MPSPHEFGTRDRGMCEILPPPTTRERLEASLRIHRNHATLYRGEIAEAEANVEHELARKARASDNLDDAEKAIEQREAELAALQEVGE